MRIDQRRLIELKFLVNAINASDYSSKFKRDMRNTVIQTYRREYLTDICGYSQGERDRCRNDFDALYPIQKDEK